MPLDTVCKWLRFLLDLRHGKTPSTDHRTKAARWSEYPYEPNQHKGHHRATTMAPNVNYCYDCGRHYRPRRP